MEECNLNFDTDSLENNQEMNANIISYLNSVFGKDIKNLSKAGPLVEELLALQKELQKKLLLAVTKCPKEVCTAYNEVKMALSTSDLLNEEVSTISKKISKLEEESDGIMELLKPDLISYQHFKEVEIYQKCISTVEDLSNQIKVSLKADNDAEVMHCYNKIKETTLELETSELENLKRFCCETLHQWNQTLTVKFNKDVETELKNLKWPFTSVTIAGKSSITKEDVDKLAQLFNIILQLEIPLWVKSYLDPKAVLEEEADIKVPVILQDFLVQNSILKLILKPLEVRFLYHFSGNKATNSRENPEWYLTQVLKWLRLHESFVANYIQPIFETNNISVVAKIEFMKGLVKLVVVKLSTDLPEILNDEDLFCQTIQGTLNFDRELRLALLYPSTEPSVLCVLTQPAVFKNWIAIERKFALELMDEFVSSEDAWIEEDGVCHAGEQLILLLEGITDRYKPLPQPGHRMQFLEFQLELLDDFRVRILQVSKCELTDPLQSNYCSILNTVSHIKNTLADWTDAGFFVEMQYYHQKFNDLQTKMKYEQISNDPFCDFGLKNTEFHDESAMLDSFVSAVAANEYTIKQDALHHLNAEDKSVSIMTTSSGPSVFEEISDLYSRIESEMLSVVTQHVLTEIRAKSQAYRKDKWFVTPSSEFSMSQIVASLEVSPSLCILLEVLVRHLNLLKEKLSHDLFVEFWKNIASHLNKYFYEEVILQNNFSEYGGAQLKHDIYKAIFPIFGEYHSKPDIFFPHVKDVIVLLTLPRPTAILLRETLKPSDKEVGNLMMSPVKALEERNIYTLNVKEAEIILNIRTNMAVS